MNNTPRRFTLSELMEIEFPELIFYIERILTTGLSLLWGAAKAGKSILILHMLLAISRGGLALGVLQCIKSEVLLISLEDGARRLQKRLKAAGAEPVEGFYIFTDWPRAQKGIDRLDKFLQENPDIKVVVIDTLFLFSKSKDTNDYSETTDLMDRLKKIADNGDLSIILIHHSKKIGKDTTVDIIETALGSTGIVAGPDHLLYLKRTPSGPSDAILHFVSKDAEPASIALKFDSQIMGWKYAGEASDLADTDERQQIIDLQRQEGSLRTSEIATKLKKKDAAVSYLLKKMMEKGQVHKLHYGLYTLNKTPDYPPQSPQSPQSSTEEKEATSSTSSASSGVVTATYSTYGKGIYDVFEDPDPLEDSTEPLELDIF